MDGGGGRTGQRKMLGQPPNGRKVLDRDEDLVLFREMHRKEKDCIVSLLQPVSDEFEANGQSASGSNRNSSSSFIKLSCFV